MNTFLDYLTVLAVAALLLAPALYGALRDRRTDRELAAAARERLVAPDPHHRRSLKVATRNAIVRLSFR
ncbi:hypothetical protein [Streptomyces sp. NPDC047976]|uniref:hypothetical protein n=1 Tax=Streptomyces sp. NPDC047976 TaxID=3155746 RepID=UPI0034157D73